MRCVLRSPGDVDCGGIASLHLVNHTEMHAEECTELLESRKAL